MFRTVLTTLVILGLLCMATADDAAAKGKTLTELSSEILESIQSFYPVRSTEMGIHEYDHRLADYSESNVKAMIKKLTQFEQDLYRFKKADLSVANRTNYHLLKSNLDIELLNLKRIRWYRKSPQMYVDEAVNGVYYLMLSEHASELQKVVSIVARMQAVPGLLATARRNLT